MADPRPIPEIETPSDLETALASGRTLAGRRIQDLDLTAYEAVLLSRTDLEGLVVLGGRLPPALEAHLRTHGALVFPTDPQAPVDPYRSSLYQPHELYAGLGEHGYEATPDALAYHWSRDAAVRHDVFVTLLRAIHDDSITDALDDVLADRPVVGVMGGHALPRGRHAYVAAARLGHRLAAAGLVVATGGGPGAMEAANLGAFCGDTPRLEDALARLAAVPSFHPDLAAWARLALTLHDEILEAGRGQAISSIGMPTWFYGHEPPNVFCDGIGKYFSNALREDGLLGRSGAGLVVLEGAAGTVQEIFQAATPLYYGSREGPLAPLVLVGREYWTDTVPVWPALHALGRERPMGLVLHLVDTADEAAAIVLDRVGPGPAGTRP